MAEETLAASGLKVLYEDNHLIAVYKPAGVLAQADRPGGASLIDDVKKYIKSTYQKPGNVFLGLIHRLDRNVSGIVLFAKTSKGASRLSEQFREGTVQKVYYALVEGRPKKDRDTLRDYLQKNEVQNKTRVAASRAAGAHYAELSYALVSHRTTPDGRIQSILRIELGTGRSHQIRAQLASIGCPIVGDVKYGASKGLPDGRLMLSASELTFRTATTDEVKNVILDEWRQF